MIQSPLHLLFECLLVQCPSPLQSGLFPLKKVIENPLLEVVLHPIDEEPIAQIEVWAMGEENQDLTLSHKVPHGCSCMETRSAPLPNGIVLVDWL